MPGKPVNSGAAMLNLLFIGTAWGTGTAAVAINATTTPLGNIYVALHTADPTATGGQNTSEIAYSGYSRVAVVRSLVGWTPTNSTATMSPNANISFPACNGATNGTAAFVSFGDSATGTNGNMFYVGALSPNITITNGITPVLLNNSTIQETLTYDMNSFEPTTRQERFITL